MLCDSIYMNGSSLSSQTHRDRKYNGAYLGLERGRRESHCLISTEFHMVLLINYTSKNK